MKNTAENTGLLAGMKKAFRQTSTMEKALFIVLAIVIIARIFTAVALPDAAYTDALYHLLITKETVAAGALPFESGSKELAFMEINGSLPPPLFYIALAGNFIATNNDFDFGLAGFFTVVLSLLQIALVFLISKKIFGKNNFAVLTATIFSAIQPVLAIYSSANYPETISTVLALFCLYIIIRFEETKNPSFLLLLPFAIAAMAVSKINAAVLAPAFLLAMLFYAWKANAKKAAAAALILTILLSGAWFFSEFQRNNALHPETGFFQKFFASDSGAIGVMSNINPDSFSNPSLNNPVVFGAELNESFWFFLPYAMQNNIPLLSSIPIGIMRIIFAVLTIPLSFLCIYGFYLMLRRKEKFSVLIALLVLLALIPFAVILRNVIIMRTLLPVLPFAGIFFARGLIEIKKPAIKKIFLLLFAIAIVYSLGFMASTAVYYDKIFQEAAPAYEFIKTLPEGSRIAAQRHLTRSIIFFSGHDAERDWDEYALMDPGELMELLKKLNNESDVDYLLSTCTKNPWNNDSIAGLEKEGFLKKVFDSGCARVYEINRN